MHLHEALSAIAAQLGLDAAMLQDYAAEDTLGGYPEAWPCGSLWDGEGRTLYALVRALGPLNVLELGVHAGASTTHLRSAVRDNGGGRVHSIDRWEGAGHMIPDDLFAHGWLTYADALAAIADLPDNAIDFVFEDLCHGGGEVRDVIQALRPKLRPGAVVVHHDSEHGAEGIEVKRGLREAGVEFRSYALPPSDCGLALWRAGETQ